MQMRYTNILKSRELINYSKHPWEFKSIRYFAICSSYSSNALLFCFSAPSAPTLDNSPFTTSTSLYFGFYLSEHSACTHRWSFCVFIKGTSPNCSSSTLDNYSVLDGMICALLDFYGFVLVIIVILY